MDRKWTHYPRRRSKSDDNGALPDLGFSEAQRVSELQRGGIRAWGGISLQVDDNDMLLDLGVNEGQRVFEIRLGGFRAWAGLSLRLWVIETADDDSKLDGLVRGWAHVESDEEARAAYRIICAEVRRSVGTYGTEDYSEESPFIGIEWRVTGRPAGRWVFPLDGKRPNHESFGRAYEMLRGAITRGRPLGSFMGDVWTRENILLWYRAANDLVSGDRRPTLWELAGSMRLSRKTARQRVENASLCWPPTLEELAEVDGV